MTAAANEAVNWSKDRILKSNWIDRSPESYPPRSTKAKRNIGRKLLFDTGFLFRSIRKFSQGATGFTYGSDADYAAVHNWGLIVNRHARSELIIRNRGRRGRFRKGTTRGRGFTFSAGASKMPKRQFLGNSAHLRALLAQRMRVEIIRRMN
jgi:phage gpG-like protein